MLYRNIYAVTLIILGLIILSIQPAIGQFEEPGEVESVEYNQFLITGASPIEFYPSDIKVINITIQNIFGYSAFGVLTVIDKDKADPIKFTQQLQKYVANEIGPKQNVTVQYEVYIKDTVPKGTYYIPLTVLWSTVADGIVKRQEDLFIGIKVAENPEVIKIDTVNVTTIPEHIEQGDTFKLKVALKNIGNSKLNQIRAALDVKMPFSSVGASTDQYISLLEPGQSAEVSYNLLIDKSALSRLYNFNFTLEYKDYTNRLQTQQSGFGINVEEASEVYIQDVTLEPTTLYPESEGLLMVQVANAGTNEVKNVRVTVFGGEKILTQMQNFIGIIRPGPSASETASFGVLVNPETELGDYGLNIQLNYDDVTGEHFSKSNLYITKISEEPSIIPISQESIYEFVYVFIFIIMSYGLFLIVGFNIEKNQQRRYTQKQKTNKALEVK